MSYIIKRGYAKINLYLDIPMRYNDGYHEVHTVMQTVSLADDVKITLNDTGKIELCCEKDSIPCDRRNIAYRAAELFFRESKIEAGVKIEIIKRIPVSAGLGGGSADAAAVLCGLNELCGVPLSKERLLERSASLGADVPFCIEGGTAFADAKGDNVHQIEPLFDCYIVIAQGGEGISTPFAYAELDKKYNNFEKGEYIPNNPSEIRNAIIFCDTDRLGKSIYNIFENVVFPIRPVAKQIKECMIANSAKGAMMSGSGTAVFGIFDALDHAEQVVKQLNDMGYFAVLSTPVKRVK